jgi:hypothetical protein
LNIRFWPISARRDGQKTISAHRDRKKSAKNGHRDAPGKRVDLMGIRNDCVCRRDG